MDFSKRKNIITIDEVRRNKHDHFKNPNEFPFRKI